MPLPQRKDDFYTYGDYCGWDDGQRWELIDGEAYAMSPAPRPRHQRALAKLTKLLESFLEDKPCKLYPAPFDVRLNADEYDDTVVQPDLSVVCDKAKIDERGCKGAPDFVIEIVSPSTERMDRVIKLNQYQRHGVREYWIVDPETRSVQACVFEKGSVRGYSDTDIIPVSVLPGCGISLAEVFAE
jgi:Uma2 family endonuclease